MKLSNLQLEQHLSQTLTKMYVICGEDPFLVQEAFALLQQKSLAADFKDRIRLNIETDADLATAYSHAYTPPLFSQKRLLELHWKGKLTKAGQQFLIHYAADPSPHALVLVRLEKVDYKTEQTQWFKALEKNSAIITIWPLPQKQFPTWLLQRAKTQGLQLTPEAAQLLAHYTEGNLFAAAQEIEKLSLLGSPSIDRRLIEQMVVDQGCFTAFDLVDHAFSGAGSQVLRILRYLQQEGTEPLLILGAFTHELRTVAKIAKELKKGSSLATLFSQYRVRITKQNGIRDFLKSNTLQNCLQLILKAGEIDRIAKGAQTGNVWEALQQLSLSIAGKNGLSHI